jgi:hypothetical protein
MAARHFSRSRAPKRSADINAIESMACVQKTRLQARKNGAFASRKSSAIFRSLPVPAFLSFRLSSLTFRTSGWKASPTQLHPVDRTCVLQSSNALSGELVTCRSSDRIVSLVSTEAILSPTSRRSQVAAAWDAGTPEKPPWTARGIGPHLLPLSRPGLVARRIPCKQFASSSLCQKNYFVQGRFRWQKTCAKHCHLLPLFTSRHKNVYSSERSRALMV